MAAQYLFVYGTLRSDCGAAFGEVMRSQFQLVGRATTQGRLYNLGHYPGMILSASAADIVTGELYRLTGSAEAMAILDRYEESAMSPDSGAEYYRTRRNVLQADGNTLEAWIYIYNRPVDEAGCIPSGDYSRFLASDG
jgi:pyruvate carboxylase